MIRGIAVGMDNGWIPTGQTECRPEWIRAVRRAVAGAFLQRLRQFGNAPVDVTPVQASMVANDRFDVVPGELS